MAGKYRAYAEYKDSGVEWLEIIPSHWNVRQLKFLCTCNDEVLSESLDDEYEIEYVDIGSVSAVDGIQKTETMQLGSAPSRARRIVRNGDVIISTVRTYLEAIASIDNPPENLVVSTGFAVIRPGAYLHKRFAAYCLRVTGFIKEVIARSVGVSYPAINASDLIDIKIPVPLFDEQQKIANFLDHETAKIDTLIEKQQQLIKLLKEKRQAVISHAVTKGLNPNAPMRDSGVEWLGEVPGHWVICRLKQLIKSGSSISYGIVQPGEPLDEGVPFVQTTNMSNGNFELDGLQKTSKEIASAFPRSALFGGEVILGIRASIGAAHIVPDSLKGANLSRGVARIDLGENISSEYLVWFFKSGTAVQYWGLSKQGSTFSEVSIETVRELAIAVPPIEEQKAICESLKSKAFYLDRIFDMALQKIDLLQERRTALISAAVTGKIDVRDWQAPQPVRSNTNREEVA